MMSVTLTLVMLVIFGSVASNANGNLSSNNAKTNKTNISSDINDVINAMSSVTLVMLVGLMFFDCQAPETLVRLVTLFSLVTLVMPR